MSSSSYVISLISFSSEHGQIYYSSKQATFRGAVQFAAIKIYSFSWSSLLFLFASERFFNFFINKSIA